jgi:uncharacterized protein (DUF1501 family)
MNSSTNNSMNNSRREFIRRSCCTAASLGIASSFSRFGLVNALAQSATDFRALVCIFLFGGNDANNMLVPMDTAGYANYLKLRGAIANGGLALDQTTLLPITAANVQPSTGSNAFGLHPNLTELQALFTSNNLAFVANVGTLAKPTTKADYTNKAVPVPENLFSHSDQQQQWQTSEVDGLGTSGWAGRMADALNANAMFPPITSVAGSAIFCTGQQTRPYAMIPGSTPGLTGFDTSAPSAARLQALQQLLTFDTGVSLIQAASSITSNSLADSKILSTALASAPTLTTTFPTNNPLANQLKQVAQILSVRSALGLNRQIFFCSLGGFDTHTNQIATQQMLFMQLSPAMNAFYNATKELNLAQNVTTFTMSDFSRTFQPASGNGSDHAWGSVPIILGGAVRGGDIYGALPTFALAGPDDVGNNGRWIPKISIDQYGATLATWFGVAPAALPGIFPNLANFSAPTLGFLG